MLVPGMELVAIAGGVVHSKYQCWQIFEEQWQCSLNISGEYLMTSWLNLDDEVMLTGGILRLLTFHGVVFIPNYSKLSWVAFSLFFRPKAAIDAHFEQTSALFRWGGRNIEIFFSPKFGELCWPDMETFGPFGGKFLGGERFIDQMKQIQGIRGILHQLKSVAFKKLNP